MARIKRPAWYTPKPILTWARFYLPRDQEWPAWPAYHPDVHFGPLANAPGCWAAWLGRLVENPEQAAYIIKWRTLDDFYNFLSSAACEEFLRNLPQDRSAQAPIESGAALQQLSLDPVSSSSSPPPSASSRFLILRHAYQGPTPEAEGRVTITSFLVPRKLDTVAAATMYRDTFDNVFRTFCPRGSEFLKHQMWWYKSSYVWFWVLGEDRWVQEKFGELGAAQEEDQGRTIFCHFFLWAEELGATPELEERSAEDAQARESWNQRIARVMPPASAWVQERWDIWKVPQFLPPEPEVDPKELEHQLEQQ